jgi:ribosomal protein L28
MLWRPHVNYGSSEKKKGQAANLNLVTFTLYQKQKKLTLRLTNNALNGLSVQQ